MIAATGLAVLALPLVLVGANVRAVALDSRFYMAEFARYDIGPLNGFSREQLREVADAFIQYFQAAPAQIDVRLVRGETMVSLFNEREIKHMEDVQALVQLVFAIQLAALAYLVGYFVVGALVGRRSFLPLAGAALAGGAGLTLLLFGVLGALALTDFSELFVQFHLLSFSNDLWQLDPRRDYLIRLFPQEFFLDAALRIALLTLAQAALLLVAGALVVWRARRSQHGREIRDLLARNG